MDDMQQAVPDATNSCAACSAKVKKLINENRKLRQKLDEVAGRRDHYATLYYKAVVQLDIYKRKIDFIVQDLEELGLAGQGDVEQQTNKYGYKETDEFCTLQHDMKPSAGIPLYRALHQNKPEGPSVLPDTNLLTKDMLSSQSAPLLPQYSTEQASTKIPTKPGSSAFQSHPTLPSHDQETIQALELLSATDNCTCVECQVRHHSHRRIHSQRSLDSAIFCGGSDSSESPICEEVQYPPYSLVGPPSPYRALRQQSLRLRHSEVPRAIPFTYPHVGPKSHGSCPAHQQHSSSYNRYKKAAKRRVASDSNLAERKEFGPQQVSPPRRSTTHYQKLSLRETTELAQFLSSTACDITNLEITDSQLGKVEMMAALCNGLVNNTSVVELCLYRNGLGQRSLEVLFGTLLKNPTNIAILRLGHNEIGPESFQVLKDFVLDTSLEILDLRGLQLSPKHCEQLTAIKTTCKIIFQLKQNH